MCLSLEWIAHIIIVAIALGAAILILKVVLPDWLGPKWIAVLDIVVRAAIAIFVVIVVFDLLGCLVGWPSLRRY